MDNQYEVRIKYLTSQVNKSSKLQIFYGNTKIYFHEVNFMYHNIHSIEQKKADKFIFNEDRQNYIVSHYILNNKLSATLQKPITKLGIINQNMQKPHIVNSKIDFNLSHSKNYFCFGITKNAIIGVDIEKISFINDMYSIVNNYMHIDEKKYIYDDNIPLNKQLIRFYEIWTRKEAFLKMLGIGIATDLKNINMSPDFNVLTIDNLPNDSSRRKVTIHTWVTNDFVLSISSNLSDTPILQDIY